MYKYVQIAHIGKLFPNTDISYFTTLTSQNHTKITLNWTISIDYYVIQSHRKSEIFLSIIKLTTPHSNMTGMLRRVN